MINDSKTWNVLLCTRESRTASRWRIIPTVQVHTQVYIKYYTHARVHIISFLCVFVLTLLGLWSSVCTVLCYRWLFVHWEPLTESWLVTDNIRFRQTRAVHVHTDGVICTHVQQSHNIVILYMCTCTVTSDHTCTTRHDAHTRTHAHK